jgi:IPT/TIG domain
MPLYKEDGTLWSKSALTAALTTDTPETTYTVPDSVGRIFETFEYVDAAGNPNSSGVEPPEGKKLWKAPGDKIKQSELDAVEAQATVTTIAPATGPAAGGTNVTLTGTNLEGVTAVTFGGVAATNLDVVSDTEVTVTTPAHATGAVNVVITDDSGTVTKTGAFTYV